MYSAYDEASLHDGTAPAPATCAGKGMKFRIRPWLLYIVEVGEIVK